MKKIIGMISVLFLLSCTYSVVVDDLLITNELCDDLIEQFADEVASDYVPYDYGCNGYDKEEGECLILCVKHDNCDNAHYCNYDTNECWPKSVGKCSFDEYCLSSMCLCDMCLTLAP